VSSVHEAEADGKKRAKKAIYFWPVAAVRERGVGAETGAGASNFPVSQISQTKAQKQW